MKSDFRVFYRIDNILELDSVTFLRFAFRVGAYEGVIRARAEIAHSEAQEKPSRKEPIEIPEYQEPKLIPINYG